MAWLSIYPEEPRVPFADMDYQKSPFKGYELNHSGELAMRGAIPFKIKWAMRSLAKADWLNCNQRKPLVRGRALTLFRDFVGDQVQFYPTQLVCKDGVIDDYYFAKPIIELACTDFSKSDVDWISGLDSFVTWNKWVLWEDCLKGHHYVQDEHSHRLIFSDEFKRACEDAFPKWTHFVRTHEYKN